MGLFTFNNKPGYDRNSVRQTLEHSSRPKLTQNRLFSMNPMGYAGSVYEDPRSFRIVQVCGVFFMVIGIVVAVILGSTAYNAYAGASAAPDSVKALDDQSDQIVPIAVKLMPMADDEIVASLKETYNVYQSDSGEDGISCVGLPDSIDEATIITYYMSGLNNLTLDQTASLLRTSWFVSTAHGDGNNVKVKYADFVSGSESKAIQKAVQQQGLSGTSVLSSGSDDSGNTYSAGQVNSGDETYYWKVAACPLSDVYSVDGLPSDAVYVGVTIADYELISVAEEETESTQAA